ncbi:tumor necrosis factor alpha-induced protein 8-like protein [Artemia franciscana]|uniref:tumor necrosis factor alpha-induced protein 8-like protein n=1 Tax=Artemia franciscana TaxID=6661 RepID=UPI0032DB5B54
MSDGFKAREVALKAQKKLLSKVSNKTIAKAFIDESTGFLLDNLYRICKLHAQSKKEAEKIVKNIIKIVVKVGFLAKNDQFGREELIVAENFRRKFHSLCMTVVSFHEVDFSYDRTFLLKNIQECQSLLKQLVEKHLTDNSIGRIEMVFTFFSDSSFLDNLFKRPSEYHEIMKQVVQEMHTMMDQGGL